MAFFWIFKIALCLLQFYNASYIEACIAELDPRGGSPGEMNEEARPWLHILPDQQFTHSSNVHSVEYHAHREGLMYVGIWTQVNDTVFTLRAKIAIQTQLGYHIFDVAEHDNNITVYAGDVVGLHFPVNTSEAVITCENPRLQASPGFESITERLPRRLSLDVQDDGWDTGYIVQPNRHSCRALPLTVKLQCAVDAEERDISSERPIIQQNGPLWGEGRAQSSENKRKKQKDGNSNALIIGLVVPFVAIILVTSAVIVFFVLIRKNHVFHNFNRILAYKVKGAPSETTSSNTYDTKSHEATRTGISTTGGDFYNDYEVFMQRENETEEHIYAQIHNTDTCDQISNSANVLIDASEVNLNDYEPYQNSNVCQPSPTATDTSLKDEETCVTSLARDPLNKLLSDGQVLSLVENEDYIPIHTPVISERSYSGSSGADSHRSTVEDGSR